MKRSSIWLCSLIICALIPMASYAGQLEEGTAAMKKGDYQLAHKLLLPLAEEGNAVAQDAIGTMLCEGLGVGMDEIQAVSWYEKAADQGYAKSEYALGIMYVHGQGVEKDRLKGMSLIAKAAQQGLVIAQQDAYALYYKEAEDGNVVASHNVAYMCLEGWAGDVNPYDCVKLLEKAAEGGFVKSASALADIYSEGKYGIKPDEKKAAYWKNYSENQPGVSSTE